MASLMSDAPQHIQDTYTLNPYRVKLAYSMAKPHKH